MHGATTATILAATTIWTLKAIPKLSGLSSALLYSSDNAGVFIAIYGIAVFVLLISTPWMLRDKGSIPVLIYGAITLISAIITSPHFREI